MPVLRVFAPRWHVALGEVLQTVERLCDENDTRDTVLLYDTRCAYAMSEYIITAYDKVKQICNECLFLK